MSYMNALESKQFVGMTKLATWIEQICVSRSNTCSIWSLVFCYCILLLVVAVFSVCIWKIVLCHQVWIFLYVPANICLLSTRRGSVVYKELPIVWKHFTKFSVFFLAPLFSKFSDKYFTSFMHVSIRTPFAGYYIFNSMKPFKGNPTDFKEKFIFFQVFLDTRASRIIL